ncbi:uncharacterized protein LTHEOB_5320 [Lasiodiplodia theobromae]|uniref:uncharacterized protein n=1 Tax=Lasiodiplodia theobromae TaxID=45133 RepID=UPI0015C307E5|nr:uncharacterized protein LTHEOB_5320 [Lasiodiplodia theobromae]KAF4545487.1 hypothetical protein LTHEOB_5320 [Lasiodiplodia theobromae]
MQPQTAPSPLSIFDAPFLDGDFDFQAFLPPMPQQQQPVDTSMHDAHHHHHPQPPPSDRRQECLQKLADLHSALMADLNTVRASRVATESSITTLRADAAAHENCSCNVPIGRMLTTSAQLLEILHYFLPSPASSSPSSSPPPPPPASSTSPEDSELLLLRPDIPTTLSILACYAALRRIYRTIFATIDASLQNFPPPLRSSALPPLFPGLALGGFQLGGNVGLQVLIVAQLSESMMAKIDAALGVGGDGGGGGGGGLVGRQPAAKGVLEAVVREEEAEGAEEGIPGGERPLREIIGCVKRAC